jgi:hypothetical protein
MRHYNPPAPAPEPKWQLLRFGQLLIVTDLECRLIAVALADGESLGASVMLAGEKHDRYGRKYRAT